MLGPLKEALEAKRVLVSDGGIGTELQKAGLEPGGCGDSWNVLYPERVKAVHRAYLDAGSQLITTNTFAANRFLLSHYALQSRVAELNLAGARLAREVAGDKAWIMGSVGPCGGFLKPLGEIPASDLEASLREQIGALLEGGVDALIFETHAALDELELGIRVARTMHAPLIFASLAYDKVRGGYKTMMGVSPAQAVEASLRAGADVVGANCGSVSSPWDFVQIAQLCRNVTTAPLILQPNGGKPRLEGTIVVYPTSAEEMGRALLALAQHGRIVGGCCGSSPEHIRAFSAMLARTTTPPSP
jgi:5-methyltetrahydrofolate--homocysteine methyltransferase